MGCHGGRGETDTWISEQSRDHGQELAYPNSVQYCWGSHVPYPGVREGRGWQAVISTATLTGDSHFRTVDNLELFPHHSYDQLCLSPSSLSPERGHKKGKKQILWSAYYAAGNRNQPSSLTFTEIVQPTLQGRKLRPGTSSMITELVNANIGV